MYFYFGIVRFIFKKQYFAFVVICLFFKVLFPDAIDAVSTIVRSAAGCDQLILSD